MKIYCTPCCKEKRADKELLEAISRYQSERILAVFKKSEQDHVEFRILSGTFGLVHPREKIPFYDHQLTAEEIPQLTQKVKQQLAAQNIDAVVFFSKTTEMQERKPYADTITQACTELGIPLELQIITD